jgi:Mg2+ and Co2+ transporter CorA
MVSNAFFFLFKDGTLISFHQGDRSFGDPVYQRLRHVDTVLRKDPEASLLMQGLLDLIVDQAVQVVDKYGDKINERETQVLLKPNMNLVQSRT